MIKCDSENLIDVALLEIAEGLLSYEFGTPGEIASGLPVVADGSEPAEIPGGRRIRRRR